MYLKKRIKFHRRDAEHAEKKVNTLRTQRLRGETSRFRVSGWPICHRKQDIRPKSILFSEIVNQYGGVQIKE